MTIVEQRKHERHWLERQPDGEFRLQALGQIHDIPTVKNISRSGIQIHLHTAVPLNTHVAVEYSEPSLKLEVNGLVVWCTTSAHDPDSIHSGATFEIGIQLLSPVLLMAMSGFY